MSEKVRVVVYLDPESRALLEREAALQGRSLSGFFRWLAINWVSKAKGGENAKE